MKRKISACLLIVLLSFVDMGKAAPVDSNTAKTVAANFYVQNYKVNSQTLSLVFTEKSASGTAEYYIYNVSPGGFVIVSAEDYAQPILGYSNEGNYSTTHLSPEFVFWMQHYKNQIETIRQNNIKATSDIQNEWNALIANSHQPSAISHSSFVNPLVKTVWAQEPYFNAECPGGSVAGCVATAMGQILKYWAYPPHGLGSHTYTDNSYGSLSANFDTTQYNWTNMPDNVLRSNPSVATLMYDLGVSVDMRYSPVSSGSFMINGDSSVSAQGAFAQYFGYYSPSIQGLYTSNYTSANWTSLLENELNNNRPFLYAGSGDSGSHAWVCDGYNTSGDFHMNWGWQGFEDGYYALNALNPDEQPLSSNEEALIGLQPAPAVASFGANTIIIRAGDTVNFVDNSIGSAPITSWQWSFPGALTTSSTTQNPAVTYPTPGTYNVSETVASTNGSNTLTQNNYITVLENNTVNVYPTENNGSFTVQLHDASLSNSNIVFSLYDVLGQKIFTTTLVQYITQLTITVPHGEYLFRAYDNSGKPVATGKMMM